MKSSFVFYMILILIASLLFACLIPQPIISSGYDAYSAEEQKNLNDAFEIEPFDDPSSYSPYLNSTNNVQNLDWFEVIDSYFKKYTLTARVIDVYTKKSYFVQRVGGYNHADVQPIDAKNTMIMLDIYDGVWSWTRRPVWVEIQGAYFAGSINGMPHSYTLIEGNNMNGHTCIHFLNSKTHGTKRVDEAHQAAVAYAYAHRSELANINDIL